ncbi:hypothetical protein TNCT6_67730 [Streptomyces sp. 6-11-2]|nr:hypothetical protein TNCT6_67730 [Streptomyces sp. 6-11-2]
MKGGIDLLMSIHPPFLSIYAEWAFRHGATGSASTPAATKADVPIAQRNGGCSGHAVKRTLVTPAPGHAADL